MFFGTTPAIISNFFAEEIKRIRPARVIVPFAGNFVIEQIAGIVSPECQIISTDVSLYSRALGHYFDGKGSEIRVLDEIIDEFPGLGSIEEPLRSAVAVLMLGEISRSRNKMDKPFYRNQVEDCRQNSFQYAEMIVKKLEGFRAALKNYRFLGTDGVDLCNQVKKDDLVFYDPPVILGDYEKMYAPLEKMFQFTPPEYTQMTDEVKADNLFEFTKNGVIAYYRTNHILEEEPEGYTQVFQHRYKHHAHYCVYTNSPKNTFVGSFEPLKEEFYAFKMISEKDEITENSVVNIMRVKSTISNHYRLLWVKKAEMADTGIPYMIFVDGLMIGLVVLMPGIQFTHDMAVILSDPATTTSRYKRLSKLILYIACTREMLDRFNEDTMWEHNRFTTRVFTNDSVSMKYRSLFELKERRDDASGNYSNILIYQNADKILPTFTEGLKEWLKKESKAQKKISQG